MRFGWGYDSGGEVEEGRDAKSRAGDGEMQRQRGQFEVGHTHSRDVISRKISKYPSNKVAKRVEVLKNPGPDSNLSFI